MINEAELSNKEYMNMINELSKKRHEQHLESKNDCYWCDYFSDYSTNYCSKYQCRAPLEKNAGIEECAYATYPKGQGIELA
jgi:hypothetical protein